MKKLLIYIFIVMIISSCSSVNYSVDSKKYRSTGKNNRIQSIVLHYTATDDVGGLTTLTKENVSAHYFISEKNSEPIYNLVDDNMRAWHAGVSSFNGRNNLNDTSIGIEITNKGVYNYKEVYDKYGFFIPYEYYIPYTDGQIKKIAFLIKKLSEKYDIKPQNIVGHSDIAPTRKIDPGAKFPWEYLYYKYGIGIWYNVSDKNFFMNSNLYSKTTPKLIKAELRKLGYDINDLDEWDEASRRVVYAFQCHFNPKKATGNMDLESYAILRALNKKYRR